MSFNQAVTHASATIVTLDKYAIHPEVLGPNAGFLSPDLVGPLRDRIEAKGGGIAIFMNGAQGDMITADNRDLSKRRDPLRAYWEDARTWEECLRIGGLMADEALRIVSGAPLQEHPSLYCAAMNVTLPVESAEMWLIMQLSPLHYPQSSDRSVTTRINVVKLGNEQVITIPGEALPNLEFYLLRTQRSIHHLLHGNTHSSLSHPT